MKAISTLFKKLVRLAGPIEANSAMANNTIEELHSSFDQILLELKTTLNNLEDTRETFRDRLAQLLPLLENRESALREALFVGDVEMGVSCLKKRESLLRNVNENMRIYEQLRHDIGNCAAVIRIYESEFDNLKRQFKELEMDPKLIKEALVRLIRDVEESLAIGNKLEEIQKSGQENDIGQSRDAEHDLEDAFYENVGYRVQFERMRINGGHDC